jgi:hypothetical protein
VTWPTPTTQDASNDGGPSQFERNSLPLNAAVKLWPTPTAGDSRSSRNRTAVRRNAESSHHDGETLLDAVDPESTGGQLNPTWVEWLMGFPLGWTDCEDSATP